VQPLEKPADIPYLAHRHIVDRARRHLFYCGREAGLPVAREDDTGHPDRCRGADQCPQVLRILDPIQNEDRARGESQHILDFRVTHRLGQGRDPLVLSGARTLPQRSLVNFGHANAHGGRQFPHCGAAHRAPRQEGNFDHRCRVDFQPPCNSMVPIDPPLTVRYPSRHNVYNPSPFDYHHWRVRIIDRYITRELLIPFLLGIGMFTSILLVARILKLVEMVVNRGVPFFQVLKLFSYVLPAFLEVTVPMALLLAVLVAFGRLSSDSEIIALQASGVGVYRLVVPVGVFAVVVAVITLGLGVYARPWGNSRLRSGLYEIVKARASAGIREKVFNDDFLGLVLYVDRIEPPGNTLHGILIADSRDPEASNTIFARFGFIASREESQILTLRLLDGSIYTGSRTKKGYQETRFSTYDINLDLVHVMTEPREKDASEMTLQELRQTIARKAAVNEATFVEQVELQRRFSISFACLVFGALGVSLGVRPSRAVHSRGFSVSLALIFVYYLLLTLGQNLGERGLVPAVIAVWIPNVLLSFPALYLLHRTARGASEGGGLALYRVGTLIRTAIIHTARRFGH
jgi:lipopolysaccharide export system permease protein